MRAILLSVSLLLLFHVSANAQKDFYEKRWSGVYRFEVADLPQSALTIVDTIYYKAKKDKNVTETVKALLYQSKFAVTLQENSELIVVEKFKKEIEASNGVLKNVLESMLAQVYWQYFQNNRWKQYNRSRLSETTNATDFRMWDAAAMLKEIDLHFQQSLANTALLKNTRLESFDNILALAEHSKLYRPTLYDFLVHYALDFYAADEKALQEPTAENTFEISNYFAPVDTVAFNDSSIRLGTYRALRLFKDLLAFHKERRDTGAYVNLEIERLNFVEKHSTRDDDFESLKNALTNLKQGCYRHPVSTLADLELASLYFNEGANYSSTDTTHRWSKKIALAICNDAITRFPDSDGAGRCKVLKERILSKRLAVRAEKFLPAERPSRMLITYTNESDLYIHLYKVSAGFEKQFMLERNDSTRVVWLAGKAVDTLWQAGLPATHDYQIHSTELVLPALAHGHYLVVVSEQSKIAEGVVYAFESVRVSNLALLEIQSSDVRRFQVVDRNNGKPITGADVHFVYASESSPAPGVGRHLTTDRNGFIELNTPAKTGINIEAVAAYKGDTVLSREFYYYKYPDPDQEEDEDITAKAFVFTDRSIYRPGQTVFFKGILVKTKNERSGIVAGEYVEISLEDVNGKDVGSQRLKTNAYGSFSGEFKLPATGVTGEYTLDVDQDYDDDSKFYDDLTDFEYSEVAISVEEYKRPTFEVNMKPLTGTFKLNDTIRVAGNATAYNNSKISKAKVAYTVTREVRYPRWYYWRSNSNNYSRSENLAHGEVYTDEKGMFIIPFKAVPDEKVSQDAKPVFTYKISADVTDINGETRSAESHVQVGYHTMMATIKAPLQVDIQKAAVSLSITTENLNGQFLPANGTMSIYKLQGPARPTRQRPWQAPDQPAISKDEFEKLFPNDSYKSDISQPEKWEKGKLAKTLLFDTKKSKEVGLAVDKTWAVGAYIIELKTTDSLGQVVEDKMVFDVVDSKVKGVSDNVLLIFKTDKNAYQPGQVAKVTIGSAAPDANVTIEVERGNKIVKTITRRLSASTEEISIPVTDVDDGAFSIHCSTVLFNSAIQQHRTISVESEQQKLSIETATFKDKLQPGSKEMWSFTINGTDGQRVEAEVLASMYDASLDQFKTHQWDFDPIGQRYHRSTYHVNGNQSFGVSDFLVKNLSYNRLDIPRQNYDEFDWFGFSLTNRDYVKRRYLNRLYFDPQSTGKPSKVTMSNNRKGRAGFISGWVTSSEGEALPGVNVVVKGTNRGTVTDVDGYYSIEATKDDVLEFSFIGLVSAEVKVGRKNAVDVAMEQDIMQLSEVVVVGYGVQQVRKNLTYSSVVITKESTLQSDVVFEEALAGKAEGLFFKAESGTDYRVMIRGSAAFRDGLSSSGRPLYVVDGVVVESSTIEQSDVADIQVLKDATATALYGSRGANGVIVITTKSGQQKLDNELAKVNARKNFNETAFFYPHLTTNEDGKIKFWFTTPESLTRWKLQLLAHTKDLVSVTKTLSAVTQKEMMVTPNVPRFLRAGDEVVISAKVANLSNRKLDGKIALQLTNPVNEQPADQLFANVIRNQTFKTGPKGNTQISWTIKVPQGIDAIQYKIVAKAGNFSDGEQNILPVLQNRMLVTETMPLYVRSNQTKTFNLAKLQTQSSATLQHHQLTLEVTSNPAWYAIQALPYLMEFPHECAEQLFSRFYANSIAGSVVNSDPKIKAVFDKWAASGKLSGNLEKNQELKSIIIEETPWLRDAESDAEQKKRLGLLFDLAAMSAQSNAVLNKLENMQFADGSFPWFAGDRYSDRYITQHVASGFGHLVKLKVSSNEQMKAVMAKAVKYLDNITVEEFGRMQTRTDADVPTSLQVHFLYMRSFYPEIEADGKARAAIDYLQKQTAKKWLEYNLYQKAMIALIQFRLGNKALAYNILSSLRENAIVSDELGMYWKENVGGWYWYESAVEIQALMIEAFAEIGMDNPGLTEQEKQKTVDELRIWLLKNKQTNSWRTTKATTEAVYALLLNGTDWLTLDNSVDITVGKNRVTIDPAEAETGTGYFKTTWKREVITPDMANVTISKKDAGISWGGVYWQYFEDLDKITPSETPLKLKKNVYKVINTDTGEKLYALQGEILKPGDLVRIRIELTADREMEYLHMKDMRAAGFEPVDVLSGYKWQEGLGYYQSTRDVATNFFFSHVPKGVYVFEYDLRVAVKGDFSNGITTIQSMYAPEFSSHSEGIRVTIK